MHFGALSEDKETVIFPRLSIEWDKSSGAAALS
jgi:hypothetical protein